MVQVEQLVCSLPRFSKLICLRNKQDVVNKFKILKRAHKREQIPNNNIHISVYNFSGAIQHKNLINAAPIGAGRCFVALSKDWLEGSSGPLEGGRDLWGYNAVCARGTRLKKYCVQCPFRFVATSTHWDRLAVSVSHRRLRSYVGRRSAGFTNVLVFYFRPGR